MEASSWQGYVACPHACGYSCLVVGAGAFTYALSSFSLDMTKGTLTLEFPVSMQSATLNATAIVLQSATTVRVIG